jgi:23S rRNA pseudouridine1911/1915/1917 synthase
MTESPEPDYIEGEWEEPGSDPAVQRIDCADGAGMRLDQFLASHLPDISRTRVQRWIELGSVWCESRVLSAKSRLLGSEIVYVKPLPREADQSFVADPVALDVIAETDHYLIINKAAGLVVHPGAGNWRNTLLNGLIHRWPAQALLPRAGIVHRLDKDTSGLLVVARSELARQSFTDQLKERKMSRRYLTLAHGRIASAGSVEAPIGRDPALRTRMAVVRASYGKPALTHYLPLAQGQLEAQMISLLECRLQTGRTHQIRVHLAHIKHPILGDTLYGGTRLAIDRQALHAYRLGIADPVDSSHKSWKIAPPTDFIRASQACGIDLDAGLRVVNDHA